MEQRMERRAERDREEPPAEQRAVNPGSEGRLESRAGDGPERGGDRPGASALEPRANAIPLALRRSLAALRARGHSLDVSELAEQLLALDAPSSPDVAKQLVAAVLGWSPETLPDRIAPEQLRPGTESAAAGIPIEAAEFVVVDLETTGLAVDECSIIEIGAVRISRLTIVERFATLLRPPGRIPRSITALTGIDDATVAEAPTLRRGLRAFRSWLDLTPSAPFVAHNASFDSRFVARAFSDYGFAPYATPVFCTQRIARRVVPQLGRYNLDHLCAHFGLSNSARHRAAGDAEVTARALLELLDLARSNHRVATLGDLLDLQEAPTRRRRRARRNKRGAGARPAAAQEGRERGGLLSPPRIG
jgi:DNA polymerase III epsilon subunit family exonuclease